MIAAYYDSHGILWIGTDGGGVIWSDLRMQFYNRFYQDRHNEICSIVADDDHYLWLATYHKGIMRSRTAFGTSEKIDFFQVGDQNVKKQQTVLCSLKDEKGNLYFDVNDGKNGLNLYSGAYLTSYGEICGEPNLKITEPIECSDPFIRHPREMDYMILDRMKEDCNYYINHDGNVSSGSIWGGSIESLLSEMEERLSSFDANEKPEWLTDTDFERMKNRVSEITGIPKDQLINHYKSVKVQNANSNKEKTLTPR